MSKCLVILINVIFTVHLMGVSFAVPAAPDVFELEQPNGTVINARNKGDERNNWVETADGYTIDKGEDGCWYYVLHYDACKPVLSNIYAGKSRPDDLLQHIRPDPNSGCGDHYM